MCFISVFFAWDSTLRIGRFRSACTTLCALQVWGDGGWWVSDNILDELEKTDMSPWGGPQNHPKNPWTLQKRRGEWRRVQAGDLCCPHQWQQRSRLILGAFVFLKLYGGFLKMKPTTMGFPTKNDHFGVWNGGNFYILLLYWLLVYSIVLVKKIWCLATLLGTDSCIWMWISTCKEFQFRLMESPLPGTFWNNFLTVRVVEAWR